MALTYGTLSATRPATVRDRGYDAKVWEQLTLLYRGGYAIEEHATRLLPKCIGESDERHKERCKLAAYVGLFAQQIGAYASALFGQPISVTPAADASNPDTPGDDPVDPVYQDFGADADLGGSSFSQVLAQVTTTALVKQRGIIALDFPPDDTDVVNRAQSDVAGTARPYVYEVQPEEMTNWSIESQVTKTAKIDNGRGGTGAVRFTVGQFKWAILKKTTSEPELGSGVDANDAAENKDRPADEEYRVWRRADDGTIAWEVYKVFFDKGRKPKDDAVIEPDSSGTSTFRDVPLIEIQIPEPLWLGNVLGPLCLEHWRRRSALLAAQQRALLVIPYVKLGAEIGAVGGPMPSEAGQDPNRGNDPKRQLEQKGYMLFGSEDEIGFASPPTAAFEIVDKQLQDLVDTICRVAGRMAASVSSTTQALGRSGESKAMDNLDFCVVLRALGAIVRDAARRTYDLISDARGEDVKWTVHGLDQFDADEDRATLVTELVSLAQTGAFSFDSPTLRAEVVTRWGNRFLPGLTPTTQKTIRDEIVRANAQNPQTVAAMVAAATAATSAGGDPLSAAGQMQDVAVEAKKPPPDHPLVTGPSPGAPAPPPAPSTAPPSPKTQET